MSKGIAVVDIGSTGIRVLVAKVSEGRGPQIIAKADVVCKGAVKNLEIENTEEISQSLKRILSRIKDQTGLVIKSAYFNISGDKVSFMPNTDSIVISSNEDELAENSVTNKTIGMLLDRIASVELYEDEMLIDVLPRQYYVAYGDGRFDTKVNDPAGLNCSKIKADADVIVGKSSYMENVKTCAANAGIEVDGFITFSFAMPKVLPESLLNSPDGSEQSVLVIDIGGNATEYVLYYKGMPYTVGAIPVGGANITNDVAVVLNISPSEAEQLKQDYSLADDELVTNDIDVEIYPLDVGVKDVVKVSYIVQIMQARIINIFDGVADELADEGIDSSLIDSIVLCGNGIDNFKGLERACAAALGHEPTVVDLSRETGMKSSYSYACGMLRYMAGQLKYGRKASKISRECQQVTEEIRPEEEKKGVISELKSRFKNMIESFKD